MSRIAERDFDSVEIHPIDIAESLAEARSWDFERVGENQVAMAIEGSWRTYSVTIAWSQHDLTLRLICAFDMLPPKRRIPALHEMMCLANDQCWSGAFVLWLGQKLMGYRYGLNLAGDAVASPEQIAEMIRAAVRACECFYPAFQAVAGGEPPEAALRLALEGPYGRA